MKDRKEGRLLLPLCAILSLDFPPKYHFYYFILFILFFKIKTAAIIQLSLIAE